MGYFFRQVLDAVTYPLRMLLYAPEKLLAGSRSLSRISLPARVALLATLFLLVCVVVTLIAFTQTQDRPFVQAKLTPLFVAVVLVLVLIIPLVLYKALKLWLEGEASPYPDIDHAWKTGLAELDRQGIDLKQVPLFLVLGTADPRQEKSLMDAARLELNVREIPPGPAPLHWYAGPDGIYLLASGVGCSSRLSALAAETLQQESARAPAEAPAAEPAEAPMRGTIVLNRPGTAAPSIRAAASVPKPAAGRPASVASPGITGTMILGRAGGDDEADSAPMPVEKHVVKLEQHEAAEQDRRLEYLCRVVRRGRQPLCPINGVLTLLPFVLMQRSVPEAIEVQRAAKKDLGTLQRVLMVRCPVTAMVIGLEEESGFRELVRRVGHERAIHQRFGKGFSVSNPPLAERLEALAAHACGAFEDWVYALFREKDSLSKPGNAKLFALLCKIRRSVQSRLGKILVAGYGDEAEPPARGQSLLFGGCYFAGVGETDDRQAFVKAVLGKLQEQQEELEWMPQAIQEDDKYQFLAQITLVLDTLLVLALVGIIGYLWWWKK